MHPADETVETTACASCGTRLIGDYCHGCGQKRRLARLSLREFFADIVKRVFRFDRALIHTLARALRHPGQLTDDYLAGRRRNMLDPVHYYVSVVFLQFLVVALTRLLAPMMDRLSALNWLSDIGGIAATRIIGVFCMGALWRMLLPQRRRNLAETYVFALYGFGTVGILWALLPLIDLAVPAALGASAEVVAAVCLALEIGYFAFGLSAYGGFRLPGAAWRVVLSFALSYGLLYLLGGSAGWHDFLLPPLYPE